MHHNALKRQQILEILYAVLETKPTQGWLADTKLKEAFEGDDIQFGLSVLIDLGQVKRHGYKLSITGSGVVACEAALQQETQG